MKKFFTYLLCGLCLTSPTLAQTTSPVVVQPPTGSDPGAPDPTPTTPTDPTRATLDNIFAPLDKSQVPTGFLAEDALPLVPLDVFNGTLTDSSRTSPDGFRYLYATLYSAHVYGNHSLLSVQDYNARTAAAVAAAGPTVIPIMVQRVEYATVRPDAFSANLLAYSNGQVRDVAGRAQSPYLVRSAFAAAPTSSYSTTSTVSLVLSSALEVRSTGIPISNRYLDFGDGRGYLIATPDQPLTANYSTAGPKRIKVRYTYSNTQSLESWFDITVLDVAISPAAANVGSGGKGASPLGTFDGNVAPITGVRAGGTAYVYLGAGHNQITKPLIVAEGFDPSSVAPLIQENLSLNYFLTSIQTGGSFNYFSSLYYAGYDIIYIDYKNGTDDILLNAALFKEVVNRVNASKVGTEQNVVLGISMGGLVARYGLADMEKAQPGSTQTRLLILQDSPQRGANVPLGIQALLRQANISFGSFTTFDINKYLQQATALLDSPASRQLLLYRATDATSGFAANTFIEGAYRQKVTFPTGQAPPYQIVAASQGSQCGTPLFAPYTELLRLDGKIFISPLPWIIRTTYYAQTIANALPAGGQSNRVATLQLYSIIRLFGFINVRSNFIRQDYSCPTGLLAVDGVAGGTNYIGGRIPAGVLPRPASYGFGPFFQLAYSYTFTRDFCFVPTASALDLNDFNQTTLGGQNINGISTASFSRTNGFIAYSPQENSTTTSAYSNEFHTTFTARNSEWMFDQMEHKDFANSYCSTECAALAVFGSISYYQRLCPGTSAAFSTNAPAGSTIAWTATPTNLFTVTSGSGPSFTTSASGTGGTGTITATVTVGGTCATSASLTVQVGTGEPTGTYSYPGGSYLPLRTVNYVTPGEIRLTMDQSYNFTFTSNQADVPVYGGGQLAAFTLRAGQGVTIRATSPSGSACGLAGSFTFTTNGGYRLVATPNPASSDLVVTAVDGDQPETSTTPSATAPPFEVELYDSRGKKMKAGKSDKGKALVDVRELPAGLYNVRAGKGKEAISKHIEITH